jgi:hypothetical protein
MQVSRNFIKHNSKHQDNMTITRKYFEDILDDINSICASVKTGVVQYYKAKEKLNQDLKKINQYNLLSLNLSEEFYELLECNDEKNLNSERNQIIFQISISVINTSIEKDHFANEPNYFLGLQKALVQLPFLDFTEIYSQIVVKLPESFVIKMHNSAYPEILKLDNEKKYLEYIEKIIADKSNIRYKGKLNKISKKDISKIETFFENKINDYKKYIFENYPSIKDEFSYYNKWVRVYFINHKDRGAHMRIFVYEKPIDAKALHIYPYFLDFVPYEAENIEETEQKIIGGLFTYVRLDEDFESKRDRMFFSIHSIHSELINIFIQNSDEHEKDEFFKFLLKCRGHSFNHFNKIDNRGFDYVTKKEDELFYFQFLKSELKNIDVLKDRLAQTGISKNVTFVSTFRISNDIAKSVKKAGISFTSLHSLAIDYLNNDNSILLHWYIKSRLGELEINKSDSITKAQTLIDKISKCKFGIKGWVDYENICTEILQYLFQDNFRKYTAKNQSYTKDGIFRRDLIINNNYLNPSSFWADVKNDFNANLIIVDFKNYEDELDQNEFYLPTKYLNLSTGNVAFIISRKGLNESAIKLQKRLLSSDNKLVISLSDEDLIDMLRDKSIGEDVMYILDNKKFLLYENE